MKLQNAYFVSIQAVVTFAAGKLKKFVGEFVNRDLMNCCLLNKRTTSTSSVSPKTNV